MVGVYGHRPSLQAGHGPEQLYLTSFLTEVAGHGPLAVATPYVPDLHHFRGSFGGKHVIPLWRDRSAKQANVTNGALEVIAKKLGKKVSAEDLFAYTYAILSAPDYVEVFWKALETPGPRVPITTDAGIFTDAVTLGKEMLWLHTYGERFVPPGRRAGRAGLPKGKANLTHGTSTTEDRYPERWSYDAAEQTLTIGEGSGAGVIRDVDPAVINFAISGFPPVKSWLDYRMKSGAGRTSSDLDAIRPKTWSFDEELIDLLWVLESSLKLWSDADKVLKQVIGSKTLLSKELPQPKPKERKAPRKPAKTPLFG